MPLFACFAAVAALSLAAISSAAGLYPKDSAVLQVDEKNFDTLIKNSHKSSIIEFYAPWCGHCQSLKPAYEKAAKSLDGLANVAAVNCDDESNKAFCGRMGIRGFPTLKTVRVTGKIGKPIITDYQGQRSATEIVDAVKSLIPNNVKRVEDKDLDGWLEKDSDQPKAILFSEKGTTSALIKALANDYLGNMPFAQIRTKEVEANKQFNIEKYPTLIVLPVGEKDAAEKRSLEAIRKGAVTYEGEMKKSAMNDFLSKYAELRKVEVLKDSPKNEKPSKEADKAAKASKDSSKLAEASASQASEQASEAAASATTITLEEPDATSSPGPVVDEEGSAPAPVPNVPAIPEIATQEELQSKCLGPKTHTCVIALLPSPKSPESELPEDALTALSSLAKLEQKHKARGSHLFPFYAIPAVNIGGKSLKASLGLDADSLHLIAVSGKKNWWRQFDSQKGFGDVAVEGWVDGIRFGEGKKQKLPEGIVVEIVAEAETETKAKETSEGQKEVPADTGDEKQKPIIHEDL